MLHENCITTGTSRALFCVTTSTYAIFEAKLERVYKTERKRCNYKRLDLPI